MKRTALLITAVLAVASFFGCEKSLPEDLKGEIAFASSMENDGAFDIYVVSLPSKEIRQLTHTAGKGVENIFLEWSPAGKIIYSSTRDGNYEIYMINPDGTAETRLTSNDVDDFYPTMRWDGKMIAYVSTVPTKKGIPQKDIFLMDIASRKTKQLTNTPETEVALHFSPDGKKIAYSQYVMGQSEIFVYYLETGQILQLTNDPGEDINPAWTSDGKYVIFATNRNDTTHTGGDKLFDIFMVSSEGGTPPELLAHKNRYNLGMPSVSVDNQWMAYQLKREDWDWMYVEIRSTTDPKKSYILVKNIYYNRNPVWRPSSN